MMSPYGSARCARMLNHSNPSAKYIVAAAVAIDALLGMMKKLTVARTPRRGAILADCLRECGTLERLNAEHFRKAKIPAAILSLEEALGALADREPVTTHDMTCGVCGHELGRWTVPDRIDAPLWCLHCLEPASDALYDLQSTDGFGTEII